MSTPLVTHIFGPIFGATALRRPSTLDASADRDARPASIQNYSYGDDRGFIYTQSTVDIAIKAQRSIGILLTLDHRPITITHGGKKADFCAVLHKPMANHHRYAKEVGLITAVINPTHRLFRHFSTLSGPEVIALKRASFAVLDRSLQRVHSGRATFDEAIQLLEDIVAIAASQVAEPKPLDQRVIRVIERICLQPTLSLTELAADTNLSYHRLSHLFSEQMGLTLRAFQLWFKLDMAWRLIAKNYDLTRVALESGFVDSAHFCRTVVEAHGAPLSLIRKYTNSITQFRYQKAHFNFDAQRAPVGSAAKPAIFSAGPARPSTAAS